MKTVFENRMVAHVWAQQNQSEGRSNNSQFYFRDKTIFSYRDSWPLATFIKDNELLLNTERVSVTTSKHLSYVRSALKNDVKIWHVDCSIIKNPDAFLKLTPKKREKFLADKAAKEAENDKAYKKDQAKRNRERTKAKKIKDAEDKAKIPAIAEKWKLGIELEYEERGILRNHGGDQQYLRLKDKDTIETSTGATVPVKFAKKIWKQVLECIATKTEWKKNGHRLPAGNFEVDYIRDNGDLVAGCHFITLSELSDLAHKLKL